MGGFRALTHRQKKVIRISKEGPRSDAEGEAFRKELLAVLRKHGAVVVGYRKGVKLRKAKPRKAKPRRAKPRRAKSRKATGKGKKRS